MSLWTVFPFTFLHLADVIDMLELAFIFKLTISRILKVANIFRTFHSHFVDFIWNWLLIFHACGDFFLSLLYENSKNILWFSATVPLYMNMLINHRLASLLSDCFRFSSKLDLTEIFLSTMLSGCTTFSTSVPGKAQKVYKTLNGYILLVLAFSRFSKGNWQK